MIKSFKGSSLSLLDGEVNRFLEQNPNGKVISFKPLSYNGTYTKYDYIYVIEYENADFVLINKNDFNDIKEKAWKYEELCK